LFIYERNEHTDEKRGHAYEQVVRASIGTVTQVSMKFVETDEEKQKDGDKYRTEHKPHI